MKKTTKNGRCRDCAQGVIGPVHAGFSLHMDGDDPLWWFCNYCGSNHVDIEGVSQGDIYPDDATPIHGAN